LFAIGQRGEPHPFHEKKPRHLGCAHNLAELAHAEKWDKRDEHDNSGAKNRLKIIHVDFISAPRGMGPTLVRFDPATEKFQTWEIPSGGGVVRNMMAAGVIAFLASGVAFAQNSERGFNDPGNFDDPLALERFGREILPLHALSSLFRWMLVYAPLSAHA
jgi:hypothetical protein